MAEQKETVVEDLVDPVNTICVFIEGGVVHTVTGIPAGVTLKILDYDIEGLDADAITKVKLSADKDAELEEVNIQTHEYEGYEGTGLTAAQRVEYLSNSNACPFCGATDISADHANIEDGAASQEIHCEACGKRWYDIYKLVDVEEAQ